MEFSVTGTLVWYYYICPRETWLMAHQIFPDQDDENMVIGRAIGENAYRREKKEIDLGIAKLDLIRHESGELVVGEIKKTSRFLDSATHQLLFYLLQMKDIGIIARGELLIPEEKKRFDVRLDQENETEIRNAIKAIEALVEEPLPPPAKKIKYCRQCAYGEFCWS